MRLYLPTTVRGLRSALEAGVVDAAQGYAVTPALREWYLDGDEEELEYVATAAAAAASLRLLEEADVPRRVVLAADVPDTEARPSPGEGRAAVRLSAPVPFRLVASALVDDAAAQDDVRRARAALAAAARGDDDAAFVVESVEDHELAWYAVQELPDLVAAGG